MFIVDNGFLIPVSTIFELFMMVSFMGQINWNSQRKSSRFLLITDNCIMLYQVHLPRLMKHMSGVMVSVLPSSAVDHGFEPKTIKLVFVASPINTKDWGLREKTGCHGIRKMCQSGATCLPADCCFSELAL
jgi:hypothetical protein